MSRVDKPREYSARIVSSKTWKRRLAARRSPRRKAAREATPGSGATRRRQVAALALRALLADPPALSIRSLQGLVFLDMTLLFGHAYTEVGGAGAGCCGCE